jgi:hypothetical protein
MVKFGKICIELPVTGDGLRIEADNETMAVEITRETGGYSIEVLDCDDCSVGCLVIQDTVLGR